MEGIDELKDQGTSSEASDRNDSQGCSGEKNPSGNREKEMKQEFAALFMSTSFIYSFIKTHKPSRTCLLVRATDCDPEQEW